MKLAQYFAGLPESQRLLQFGRKTDHPLQLAFDHKRVVHAGVGGRMIPLAKGQAMWNALMQQTVNGFPSQMAYIHIPFCKTKCLYCGFFQNGTDQSAEDQYVACLVQELDQAGQLPRVRCAPIQAVFIGGGTPTSLSPENAAKVLSAIRRNLPLANDYELTLEGRIHDLVPEKMEVWFANGVNRMSLGVQSFNTKVRRQVGRMDSREEVLRRLRTLLDYNQCAVVIDLMYGLPDQTMDVWQQDLTDFVESGVDGADLYQLNVFKGSDLETYVQKGLLPACAATRQQADMFALGRRYLAQWGYKRLSHCHWAWNNRERSLYNTMARNGVHLFPFGCGAGGHVDGVSTMLHRSLPMYEKMAAAGQKPFMFLSGDSPLEALVASVQADMNQCHFNLARLMKQEERLEELSFLGSLWEDYGLWHFNGIQYDLTEAGQFWQVNMTQTILECLVLLLADHSTVAEAAVAAQG